jgi:putative hemolysin
MTSSPDPFSEIQKSFQDRLSPMAKAMLRKLINTDKLQRLYQQMRSQTMPGNVCDSLLRGLGISYRVSEADLSRIPRRGPVIVVANHPFGAIEGLVLGSILRSVRPDVKILANSMLQSVSEFQNLFIWVDPFGGKDATHRNIQPLREAIRWLERGGVLAAFPAGEVAHFQYNQRTITDPSWKVTITRIARRLGLPILTVYFCGVNSPTFQMLGLLHPGLRTALLIREMLNKRNHSLDVRIGRPIAPTRLKNFVSDTEATEFIRTKTYLLGQRPATMGGSEERTDNAIVRASIASADDPQILEEEIAHLPKEQILCEQGDSVVMHAAAWQIPRTLREIGRQREMAFRAVGEATGKSIDLDEYDEYYVHLFLWDRQKRAIAGAYRIGHTARILSELGVRGLYACSLFSLSGSFFKRLGPALELGRAFVRRENQCDNRTLPLLWSGIVRYVSKYPECRHLYGLVSISNDYLPISRQLITWFLRTNHSEPERSLAPRHKKAPAFDLPNGRTARAACSNIRSIDDLSDIISDVEHDSKGIPVLLRHYIRLGAKVLAFNVDPNFGSCLDALVLVDLARVNTKILDRLMGKPASVNFRRWHSFHVPGPDMCPA